MKAKVSTQLAIFGTSLFLLFGVMGCNDSVDEACQSRIPTFQRQLDSASTKLFEQVQLEHPTGRGLASVALPVKAQLSLKQRHDWQEWAESRLKEVQNYMDVIQGEPKFGQVHETVKDELSEVAKDMVSLDGFSEQNQARFMEQTLEHARQHADNAARLTCPQEASVRPAANVTISY
jgi:hypothetical protein